MIQQEFTGGIFTFPLTLAPDSLSFEFMQHSGKKPTEEAAPCWSFSNKLQSSPPNTSYFPDQTAEDSYSFFLLLFFTIMPEIILGIEKGEKNFPGERTFLPG